MGDRKSKWLPVVKRLRPHGPQTSLDHLPEKKQHQLHRLDELIRKEADVEIVILFGSFARGDWVEDPVGGDFSDFDVLVVVITVR